MPLIPITSYYNATNEFPLDPITSSYWHPQAVAILASKPGGQVLATWCLTVLKAKIDLSSNDDRSRTETVQAPQRTCDMWGVEWAGADPE